METQVRTRKPFGLYDDLYELTFTWPQKAWYQIVVRRFDPGMPWNYNQFVYKQNFPSRRATFEVDICLDEVCQVRVLRLEDGPPERQNVLEMDCFELVPYYGDSQLDVNEIDEEDMEATEGSGSVKLNHISHRHIKFGWNGMAGEDAYLTWVRSTDDDEDGYNMVSLKDFGHWDVHPGDKDVGKDFIVETQVLTLCSSTYYGDLCETVAGPRHIQFSSVYTIKELRQLYKQACWYEENSDAPAMPCHYLYRNKPKGYFDCIKWHQNGIMRTMLKTETNGDLACPANNRLKGTYFLANVMKWTGEPPEKSPFGDYRLLINVDALFSMGTRLYFADFYCMGSNSHWLTLVLTHPGSDADKFCNQNLLRVDRYDNPFFFRSGDQVMVNSEVWLEIFYTKDIDITEMRRQHQCFFRSVPQVGQLRHWVRKREDCEICTLP